MGTLVNGHGMWDGTHPHPQDGQSHPRPDMSGSGSNSGEAAGSTLGGNDYHGSPGMSAPQEAHSTSFNLGGPNETTVGTTVVGGIEAQHQAQSEIAADAVTAKSDLADTKALQAEKLKGDVAKQQQNRANSRH